MDCVGFMQWDPNLKINQENNFYAKICVIWLYITTCRQEKENKEN